MKIRNDYITNSSSSNYIIAYKSLPDIDEETLAEYPFLQKYEKIMKQALFGEVYKTKEEWDKSFIDMYKYLYNRKDSKNDNEIIQQIIKDDEYLADMYNKGIEYIEKGFYILEKSVNYDDTFSEKIIMELAQDNEDFVILDLEE